MLNLLTGGSAPLPPAFGQLDGGVLPSLDGSLPRPISNRSLPARHEFRLRKGRHSLVRYKVRCGPNAPRRFGNSAAYHPRKENP